MRLITLRFWTWVGVLSYGVYLWHYPILVMVNSFTDRAPRMFIDNWEGIEAGWQKMRVFHAIQLPVVIGLTLVVLLITFFIVETRFRPHLYRWDSSKYFFRHLPFLARR